MRTQNRIAELREAAGLSRAELARALGIDYVTLYRWERGHLGIKDERKFELAEWFGVSVPYLMGWPEKHSA